VKTFVPALRIFIVLTIVTGVMYPLLVTGVAQALFPHQANGSLIKDPAKPDVTIGSELIGQEFDQPKYFWGRISATTPMPYNAGSSGGSNIGPTNPALKQEVVARITALKQYDYDHDTPIPTDLVTSSGSGLDPDITPEAAIFQIPRVAKTRSIDPAKLKSLVERLTQSPQLGILGEPRVNVLALNLALDRGQL
jgi:K+-transporting ATPase ATPase C chain